MSPVKRPNSMVLPKQDDEGAKIVLKAWPAKWLTVF